MRWLALALLIAAGCYSPSYVDCEYRCSTNNTCPDGLTCKAGACRTEGGSGSCDVASDARTYDAAPDSMISRKLFDTPETVANLDGFSQPTLTADEQEIWLVKQTAIYHAAYDGSVPGFGMPTEVPALMPAGVSSTTTPAILAGGTVIYYAAYLGSFDVLHAVRNGTGNTFGNPSPDSELDTAAADERPGTIDMEGHHMILTIGTGDGSDLYESLYPQTMWLAPVKIDELSSAKEDSHPSLSGDGLTVVFASRRSASNDLYIATRASLTAPFVVEPIAELNTAEDEGDPWLSPSGHVIYFARAGSILRAETPL